MNRKQLQYFEGKPCTIFTTPINRDFKEENPNTFPQQSYHYFLGIVDSVDDNGVMMRQLTTNLKSFFFFPHIVGIAEEEVLNPDNEQHAKVINSMKTTKQEVVAKYQQVENRELDLDAMSALVKNTKK